MQVKTLSCKAKVVDQQHPEMPLTHVLLELKRKQVIHIVPKHLLSVVTGKGDVTCPSHSFFLGRVAGIKLKITSKVYSIKHCTLFPNLWFIQRPNSWGISATVLRFKISVIKFQANDWASFERLLADEGETSVLSQNYISSLSFISRSQKGYWTCFFIFVNTSKPGWPWIFTVQLKT